MKNDILPIETQTAGETHQPEVEVLNPEIFTDAKIPIPPREPELDASEERIERIERLLSDVSPGWQVAIQREEPAWCKGHLETIDIYNDSDPISLDYLQRQWGGDKLRIRIKDENRRYIAGCEVQLYSFPPKRFGKRLRDPFEEEERKAKVPASDLGELDKIVNIIEKLKGPNTTDGTAEIVKLLLRNQIQQQQPQIDRMSEIVQMASAIQQLKGIFGEPAAVPAAPSVDDGMLGQLNGLLDMFMKVKGPPVEKPTITAPKKLPTSNPAAPNDLITHALANMGPDEVAETFLKSVGGLPEDKRTAIFESMFGMLGIDPGNDNDDDEDSDDSEDDE